MSILMNKVVNFYSEKLLACIEHQASEILSYLSTESW